MLLWNTSLSGPEKVEVQLETGVRTALISGSAAVVVAAVTYAFTTLQELAAAPDQVRAHLARVPEAHIETDHLPAQQGGRAVEVDQIDLAPHDLLELGAQRALLQQRQGLRERDRHVDIAGGIRTHGWPPSRKETPDAPRAALAVR
jgi:hypothetical protein